MLHEGSLFLLKLVPRVIIGLDVLDARRPAQARGARDAGCRTNVSHALCRSRRGERSVQYHELGRTDRIADTTKVVIKLLYRNGM